MRVPSMTLSREQSGALPGPTLSRLPTILLGLQGRGLELHPVPRTCLQLGRRMLDPAGMSHSPSRAPGLCCHQQPFISLAPSSPSSRSPEQPEVRSEP